LGPSRQTFRSLFFYQVDEIQQRIATTMVNVQKLISSFTTNDLPSGEFVTAFQAQLKKLSDQVATAVQPSVAEPATATPTSFSTV
jgi:hypothetical protein